MMCFVMELNSLGLLCTAVASSRTQNEWKLKLKFLAGVRCVSSYYACLSLNWFARNLLHVKSWLTPSVNTGQAIEHRQWKSQNWRQFAKMGMEFFFFSQSNEFRQKTLKLQTVPIKGIFCSFPPSPREKNRGWDGGVTGGNKGERCRQMQ